MVLTAQIKRDITATTWSSTYVPNPISRKENQMAQPPRKAQKISANSSVSASSSASSSSSAAASSASIPMLSLNNFPHERQKFDNSCWAAVARSVHNYYVNANKQPANSGPVINSDQDAAAKVHIYPKKIRGKMNVPNGNPVDVLVALQYTENEGTFTTFLPDTHEISTCIQEGKPIICCVKNKAPARPNPPNGVKGGHWIAITGISNDGGILEIYDPQQGITDKQLIPNANQYKVAGHDWHFHQSIALDQGIITHTAASSSPVTQGQSSSSIPAASPSLSAQGSSQLTNPPPVTTNATAPAVSRKRAAPTTPTTTPSP